MASVMMVSVVDVDGDSGAWFLKWEKNNNGFM
jgi:hypothetical protein